MMIKRYEAVRKLATQFLSLAFYLFLFCLHFLVQELDR